MSMYFLSPPYVVVRRTDSLMVVKTFSGASVIPLVVIIVVLSVFPMNWVAATLAVAYLIVMSYQRFWEIDTLNNKIVGEMNIFSFGFTDVTIDLNSIVELKVEYYQGSSRYYRVVLKDSDGVATSYAARLWSKELVPIVRDLRTYLPRGISYSINRRCKREFSFLEQPSDS